MAQIKEFTVFGLGGRDRVLTYKLNSSVNVFWGLNGSGKTSLLRILHSAMDNSTRGLVRVPFSSAIVIITHAGITFERRIDKVEASGPANMGRRLTVSQAERFGDRVGEDSRSWNWETVITKSTRTSRVSRDYAISDARLPHSFLPISRVAESRLSAGRSRIWPADSVAMNDEYFDSLFAEQVRSRWQSYNSEALEKIESVQRRGIGQILSVLFSGPGNNPRTDFDHFGEPEQAFTDVKNFLKVQKLPLKISRATFLSRYNADPAMREIVANIQGVMVDVDVARRPQEALQHLISELYSGDKKLHFGPRGITVHVGEDEEIMPLESLSSGERQLLQILLETLAADHSSVIVDEPELSMHVDWQRLLINAMHLVNPHCQLILATHSPEILAYAPGGSVFEL